ncbi:hypothetical protein QR680_014554 [Steinernema hermaphroditum]|uniref:RING-type domain-containing protein n=1 Tax=Steinernema hermaphroditum TaxID=289476 RepID=A0AA39IBW0_9BILA|nr:hypothetical protein QR680_014554 [Steinernema hermaphroditum]
MCALLAADRKELTCPVCLEIFQNPKVVPKCGHSLCSTCEVRISVEDPIQKKKTLSCPVCLAAVELNIDEYLPVNWIVKDLPTTYNHHRGGSPKKPKHSLKCSSCNAPLSQKNTFDCEFCAELDQNIEVLICATCVFDYHKEHINSVQRVRFADAAYKMGKIGGISRDAEELGRKKASTLMELDVFFGQLEQYCERVKSRLEKLGGKGPMTQKVVDKEVEELMKDYGVIKRVAS